MDNNFVMKLPELNCLKPDEHTTFKKLVEEIAECNTALEDLTNFEKKHSTNWLSLSDLEVIKIRDEYKSKLSNVLSEIMDIAQVCASQLFVFEKKGLNISCFFKEYSKINKLKDDVVFYTKRNCRYVFLPKNDDETSIQIVMNKIIFCMGIIAQLDKFTGKNGEIPVLEFSEAINKYIFNLLDIIQCCFNLLFSMKEKYFIDIESLFKNHLSKLIKKGYYKENNVH